MQIGHCDALGESVVMFESKLFFRHVLFTMAVVVGAQAMPAQAVSITVDAPGCTAGGALSWTAANRTVQCLGGSPATVGNITVVVPDCTSGFALAWNATARTVSCQPAGGPTTPAASVAIVFSLPNCLAGAVTWSPAAGILSCPAVAPPTSIATFSGSGQATAAGTPFDNSLIAIVRDAGGNPRAGVDVTFHVPQSGAAATLFQATVVTDEDGLASASASANMVLGGYAVTATAAGLPATTTFALTNTAAVVPPAATLNIDKSTDAAYDSLTDGLLVLRHMFGLRGEALTDGALAATALRNDPVAIATALDDMSGALDIDDNGAVDALTDGMLVLRYMFGMRGASLVNGAVAANARAATPAAVEARLQALTP